MNRFEEMNVTEQQEISGGSFFPVMPVLPYWQVKLIEKAATAGAVVGVVAGGLFSGALDVLSGK